MFGGVIALLSVAVILGTLVALKRLLTWEESIDHALLWLTLSLVIYNIPFIIF